MGRASASTLAVAGTTTIGTIGIIAAIGKNA
jgi:hypothetical protein